MKRPPLSPGMSVLTIRSVTTADAGMYRCRVDFRTAQTRNALINVSIISEFFFFYLF